MPDWLSLRHLYWRLGLHLLCALPAPLLLLALLQGRLTPDPAKVLLLETGEMAIRLLLLCLTVSPLRRLTGGAWLALRRPLGLWAAAWATAHAFVFFALYLGWDWRLLPAEFIEHPYISVGALSVLLMWPLAVTSTRAAMRAMGRLWSRLHRLVYVAALLALLHLIWQIREDWGEAFFYSFWLLLLFAERLIRHFSRGKAATEKPSGSAD